MEVGQNLYTILGVPPDASVEEIKKAYRIGARRFHPDANSHLGAAIQFREITAAYETLNDPRRRAEYDRALRRITDRRPYLTINVTPSRRTIAPLKEPQILYLLAEIKPGRPESHQQEAALNLGLVIDRSTSMKGARLERVKAAAHSIIDGLDPEDMLSIVTFSDRAEVVLPATLIGQSQRQTLKALVTTTQAGGGTAIFQGLAQGFNQVSRNLRRDQINHILLLTDGQTYGDEPECMDLAEQAAEKGITISGMGIGQEWNDVFIDALSARTGGTSAYIESSKAVTTFLEEHIRSLDNAYAERVNLSVAPDTEVVLENAFKITPRPMPISLDTQPIPLGALEIAYPLSVLFQVQLPPLETEGAFPLARLDVTGDIMAASLEGNKAIADVVIQVEPGAGPTSPPGSILNALGKLTLYRMQEKAQEALQRGDIQEATQKLENLATRLLAGGQTQLAEAARDEARRVATTHKLSEEGGKKLKYGTRALLLPASTHTETEE